MRVIVVLDCHLKWSEVSFDFAFRQKVDAVEQDGIIAYLHLRPVAEHDLPAFDIVAILVERKAMEKFHDSAFEDSVLLLLRPAHRALDLPAERLPLLARGAAGGVVEGRGGGDGSRW